MPGASVRNVLIVGAGIAGLSASIALGQRGVSTTVVDEAQGAVGASILITHRAVHALEELGVLDYVLSAGVHVAPGETSWWAQTYDAAGEVLPVREPAIEQTGLPSTVFIYRPLLSDILTAAARQHGADVRHLESFESLDQHPDRVDAVLTSGERSSFDLVIAADGINSATRALCFEGVGGPVYTGSMSFRTMFENAPSTWFRGLHAAKGGMVVTTMLPGSLCYLAAPAKMQRRRVDQDEAREIVRLALRNYETPMFAEMSERLTEDVPVLVAPYEWILVPRPWHTGRVVLVGDAAHATTPNIGSAGSMAIEDGVVLAQELERATDLQTALEAYEDRRFERTKLVVDSSVEIMRSQQQGGRTGEDLAEMRTSALEKLAEPY